MAMQPRAEDGTLVSSEIAFIVSQMWAVKIPHCYAVSCLQALNTILNAKNHNTGALG